MQFLRENHVRFVRGMFNVIATPGGRALAMLILAFSVTPVAVFLTAGAKVLAPGDLDTTFDGDGRVSYGKSFSGTELTESVSDLAQQSDGKIVFSGGAFAGATPAVEIVRLNTDGSSDTTFGGGTGSVFIQAAPGDNGTDDADFGRSRNILVQPDGRILTTRRQTVGRLLASGSTDATFGTNGMFGTQIQIGDIVLQADGRVLVAGTANVIAGNKGFSLVRLNTNGTLDTSFGTAGRVITDFTAGTDTAVSLRLQSDGKVVVAGEAGDGTMFAVARYNTDGSLDTTFDGDGKATVPVPSRMVIAGGLAIQCDGRIVIVGSGTPNGGLSDTAVVRLLADGTPDSQFDFDGVLITDAGGSDGASDVQTRTDGSIIITGGANGSFLVGLINVDGTLNGSFGGGGFLYTDFGAGVDGSQTSLIQSDGKLLLGGFTGNTSSDYALARYIDIPGSSCVIGQPCSSGALDTTFAGDGTVTTDFTSQSDGAAGVAVQTDGKIVAVGATNEFTTGSNFALTRYNVDGSIDTTFDGDGKASTDFAAGQDAAVAVAIQTDGKIVVAGTARIGATDDFAVARYNSDGSLDTTFDSDGKVTTAVNTSTDTLGGLVLQPDGKIVVAGTASISPIVGSDGGDFALVRYNSDGSLDTSFDGDGKVTTDFNAGTDFGREVTLQPDGKLIVSGQARIPPFGGILNSEAAFARYNPDGSPDTSFDSDGKVVVTGGPNSESANEVLMQPDGKIVAAGTRFVDQSGSSTQMLVIRLDSAGAPDTTFNGTGQVVTGGLGNAVALQPDGKILAGGSNGCNCAVIPDFLLVRLNTDGTFDTTFDSDGRLSTDFAGQSDSIADLAFTNGKIIAVGAAQSTSASATRDFALARYASCLQPMTAAGASVSGRVLTAEGRGVRGASVSIFDSAGVSRSVRTGPGGTFVFEDVETGQTYIVSAASGRFTFAPQVVRAVDQVTNIDLIAEGSDRAPGSKSGPPTYPISTPRSRKPPGRR